MKSMLNLNSVFKQLFLSFKVDHLAQLKISCSANFLLNFKEGFTMIVLEL